MTYIFNGGMLPIDLNFTMKTLLYTPEFINPQAYDVFPQLYDMYHNTEDYVEYAVFSGTLTVRNVNDVNDFKTFQNTDRMDLSTFAGKLIEIDLETADGSVVLGQWHIKVDLELLTYGVEWDTTVSDSACTRVGNPLLHKSLPVTSAYKGCLYKDGAVNYYLNPNDWSLKKDGTPAVLDGTDGDVVVETPEFYYRSFTNDNKRLVRFSMTQIDDTWIRVPKLYISAYRNTLDRNTSTARSIVNTDVRYRGGSNDANLDTYLESDPFRTLLGKPATQTSRATMRTCARKNGAELLCYEYYKVIFYWAYVIEYADFNCQLAYNAELTADGYHQGGLGSGVTNLDWNQWGKYNSDNPITPCGYTNEFGNFTGVKLLIIPSFTYTENGEEKNVAARTTSVPRWRGFENPFGDIWTNLEGVVLKRDVASGESKVYTTTDPTHFNDNITDKKIAGIETPTQGFIKEFDLGDTAEIIPSVCTGANQNTYKCDNHWTNTETNTRTLLLGGGAHSGASAGLGAFYGNDGVGGAGHAVGFRIIFTSF